MKVSDNYVIISGYILLDIRIHWCNEKREYFMLAYPVINYISSETYEQEIFTTFMLADCT